MRFEGKRSNNEAGFFLQKVIYLCSLITEDARSAEEVKRRLALAKSTFSKLDNIPRNSVLSVKTSILNTELLRQPYFYL